MPKPPPLQVRWLGHACVVLDHDGTRILTDPLLRPQVGLLRRVAPLPDRDAWVGADAVLVSHLHLDHADLPSLRLAAAPALAHIDVATWLARKGITSRALGEGWAPVSPGSAVEVHLVPAEHHSRPLPGRPTTATGFLLRYGDRHVWFAGDTDDHPDLDLVAELADERIDLALLPIHGWGPRLGAGHLDPFGAARLCARLPIERVLPIHHGTLHPAGFGRGPLGWMRAPAREFAEAAAALAPDVQVVAPEPGDPAITITW